MPRTCSKGADKTKRNTAIEVKMVVVVAVTIVAL